MERKLRSVDDWKDCVPRGTSFVDALQNMQTILEFMCRMNWHAQFLRDRVGSDAVLNNQIAAFAIISVCVPAPKFLVPYSPFPM